MVKPIELKKGSIILFEGKSYLILDPPFAWNRTTENGEEPEQITSEVKQVSCPCGGNLEKLGRVKGQYKCLKCGKPVFLDENGEIITSSTSYKNRKSLSESIIEISKKYGKEYN